MSTDNGKLRTVVIGYGLAGSVFHAPLVSSTPELHLSAVVTSNWQRADKAVRQYPGVQVLSSADEVWKLKSEFDLVVVASPNDTHVPLAKAALQCGLPVVVDKPLSPSVEEARELLQLSQQLKVPLTVFHNRRWDSDFLTVKKLIATGQLGTISRIESRYERYRPEVNQAAWRESASDQLAGGLLFDLGSHLIDQCICLWGRPISVYAEIDKRRKNARVDDDTFVSLTFPAGDSCLRAHLWTSMLARVPGPRFRLLGSAGTYQKQGMDPQEAALRAGHLPSEPGWGEEPAHHWGTISSTINGLDLEGKLASVPGAYHHFYQGMAAALMDGAPLPVPPQDALLTAEIIHAARQSAAQGRAILLEEEAKALATEPA